MCMGKVCEFHSLNEKTNEIVANQSGKWVGEDQQYSEDFLALTTRYTKITLCTLNGVYRSFLSSTLYQIVSRTTQPVHLITLMTVFTLTYVLYPNEERHLDSPLLVLIYLGSFSIHLGIQIWMTFISGLALYFNLPRHVFGTVQRILFPKYFFVNAFLSFVSLSTFFHCNNFNLHNLDITLQGGSLVLCFLIEFLTYVYLAPPLLKLMEIKNKMEEDAGIGMEVGKQDLKTLATDAYYLKIHKSFRTTHMVIAIGNITSIGCSVLQLFYLANKLCVL